MNKFHKFFKTKLFLLQSVVIPVLLPIIIGMLPLYASSFVAKSLLALIGDEKADLIKILANEINLNLNYALSVILIFYVSNFFRKSNEDKVFNKRSDLYYDYCYFVFWSASKVLGYRRIQLVGIPLHMQFKLVIKGTFDEIIADTFDEHYVLVKKNEKSSTIQIKDMDLSEKEINLFIEDTYPILREEVKECKRNLPNIRIKGNGVPGVRKKDNELVGDVKKAMYEIQSNNYKIINVYSTANPINNLNIINSSFRFFGRSDKIRVFIMQKSAGSSGIYNKKYKIPV